MQMVAPAGKTPADDEYYPYNSITETCLWLAHGWWSMLQIHLPCPLDVLVKSELPGSI